MLLVTCGALVVPAAAAPGTSGRPVLRKLATQPLAVRGLRFKPAERVKVRVAAAGNIRVHLVRATAAGTFTTTFTAVVLERCTPFVITASGSMGSTATLRPRPFVDCAPL